MSVSPDLTLVQWFELRINIRSFSRIVGPRIIPNGNIYNLNKSWDWDSEDDLDTGLASEDGK